MASSIWPQFKENLLTETAKIKVGPSEKWENFMGPVMCAVYFKFVNGC